MLNTDGARWRTGIIALVLTIACAGESWGQSTQVAPEDLARGADVVAVGKVSGLASQWNADHSRIITTVKLAVDTYLKGGTAAGPLTILVPGGEVDGVGEIYSHMATVRKDENVLVFAEKDRQGNFRVSRGQQGKFDVTKDETTGKAFVGNRPMEDIASAVRQAIGVSGEKN